MAGKAADTGFSINRGEVVNSEWFENMVHKREDFVQRLFTVFVREEPKRVRAIVKALARGDVRDLAFLAHSLKGAAATMGTDRVRAVCADLDQAAKSSDLVSASGYVDELQVEMDRVYDFMSSYLNEKSC